MRAVVCTEFGPPESLKVMETAAPKPGPGEIRVAVRAAGVNFPDTLIIKGQYQFKPPMPFIPGFEVAGDVVEVGPDVKRLKVGDRMMGLTVGNCGAFAEQAIARDVESVFIPAGIDYVSAAALYTTYGTAYHALIQRGTLSRGETLVVLGATGGVGLAAVELGVALGATVIAVGRSPEKLAAAAAKGATHLVSYSEPKLGARIKALTDNKGADVCIDCLGGEAFDEMSRAMNWGGRLLIVGFTSGVIPRVAVNLLLLKGYQIAGVFWGSFVNRSPEINAANFEAMAQLIAQKKLHPSASATYPLERVPEALNDLISRRTTGKLVIKTGA